MLDIKRLSKGKEVILIAIDGVGGSGKTTLAVNIQNNVDNCGVIQLDDFYSPVLKAPDILRLKEQVLLPLRAKQDAKYQIYDWKTDSLSDWHWLSPKGIIIFEGVYALHKVIREYYDLKIWIEYPAELGFIRGIKRDLMGDGVDHSDKWKNIWMPQEAKYISEQNPRNSADFVIYGNKIISD